MFDGHVYNWYGRSTRARTYARNFNTQIQQEIEVNANERMTERKWFRVDDSQTIRQTNGKTIEPRERTKKNAKKEEQKKITTKRYQMDRSEGECVRERERK